MGEAVQLPIRLLSIFPTWAITHCFKNEEQLQAWLDERKLTIVSIVRCDNYLSVTAVSPEIKNVERIL